MKIIFIFLLSIVSLSANEEPKVTNIQRNFMRMARFVDQNYLYEHDVADEVPTIPLAPYIRPTTISQQALEKYKAEEQKK